MITTEPRECIEKLMAPPPGLDDELAMVYRLVMASRITDAAIKAVRKIDMETERQREIALAKWKERMT